LFYTQKKQEIIMSASPEHYTPQASELADTNFSRNDWADDAACADATISELSPEVSRSGPSRRPKEIEAEVVARYCGQCSVWEDCLKAAIVSGDDTSIRGGLTAKQRKPLLTAYQKGSLTQEQFAAAVDESSNYMEEYYDDLENTQPQRTDGKPAPSKSENIVTPEQRRAIKRLQDDIVGALQGLPDKTFTAETSICDDLAEIFELPEAQLIYAIRRLANKGQIEKIKGPRGHIAAIRLVS
jgi:hypothetical protein